jgi:hypothetical protein
VSYRFVRRGLPQKFVVAGLLLGLCFAFAPSVSGSQPAAHSSGPRPQLGIDVVVDNQNYYTTPQSIAEATELFAYVRSLHANAVDLNFPFYMTSLTSSDPTSGAGTPSPARIAALTMLARGMGLQVMLRPYLSQYNFPLAEWRGEIAPKNLRAWFANYWAFLRPYLVVAGSTGVASFSIAAELTDMQNYLNYWIPLVMRAKSIFGGEIIYSENFPPPLETLPGTQLGWDAYTPVILSSDAQATVANLTKGDLANYQSPGFQATPEQTTITELGISAASKAYLTPWNTGFPQGTPIMRFIQTNWFAAACNAFWTLHMKGIYFWALYLSGFSPTENDSSRYANWMDTPTATAIKSCFARGS